MSEKSSTIFQAELKLRAELFEQTARGGRLQGQFSGLGWQYRAYMLRFEFPKKNGKREPLTGFVGNLARCFALTAIKRGLTFEAVNTRLYGLKWLARYVDNTPRAWSRISKATLDKAASDLEAEYEQPTAYARAGGIKSLVTYLGTLCHKRNGKIEPFLARRLRWKPNIKNPVQSTFQRQFGRGGDTQKSRYVPELQTCLGQARYRLRSDPTQEPSPGYDLIRLEALAFGTALGLRIGEILTLPIDALDTEDSPFVRVFSEKGAPAFARSLPELWVPVISEANDYLLGACAEPRRRAREIEERGFEFIRETVLSRRKLHALPARIRKQMGVLQVDPDEHFTIDEMTECFSITPKELWGSGKFAKAAVPLPREVAALIVHWMDERVRRWDWEAFAKDPKRTERSQLPLLSTFRIAKLAGTTPAGLRRVGWFGELEGFLRIINSNGVMEGAAIKVAKVRNLKEHWGRLRKRVLQRRGDATVVSYKMLSELLLRRFKRSLERHYQSTSKDLDEAQLRAVSSKNYAHMPLSEHLIVVWDHQFAGRGVMGFLPRPATRGDFYNYLKRNPGKETIFERLNIRDQNGEIFSITPHFIRHWVTTATLRSGPSEMMVDLWMGRKPGQTRSYDHRTAVERARVAKEIYSAPVVPDDYIGRRIRAMRERGVPEAEIRTMINSKLRVMHFVPWGLCSRDLYSSPCSKGLLCLRGFGTDSACESFHIDTGSPETRTAIIALRDQYVLMLRTLEPSVADVRRIIEAELNTSTTLDQHLRMVCDVIRGCDQALLAFNSVGAGLVKVSGFPVKKAA